MPGRLLSHVCAVTSMVTSLMWLASTGAIAGQSLGQTTAFTYQGKLSDAGAPANGVFDFEFKLFTCARGRRSARRTILASMM